MADCSKITSGLVAANCLASATPGIGTNIYLINQADIDLTTSVVTSNVITSLVLETGKYGYLFQSLDESATGEASLAKGKFFSKVQHDLTIRIFVKTELAKAFINSLITARIVAIVENKESGNAGDTKYEAYGWNAGLVLTDLKQIAEMTDGVVYEVKLGSSDTSKENSLPKSVFKTDLATTETMLEALIQSAA